MHYTYMYTYICINIYMKYKYICIMLCKHLLTPKQIYDPKISTGYQSILRYRQD